MKFPITEATDLAIAHACSAVHDLAWWADGLMFRIARAASLVGQHRAAQRRTAYWLRTLAPRLARPAYRGRDVDKLRIHHVAALARSQDRADLLAGLAMRATAEAGPAPDYDTIAKDLVTRAKAATLAWFRASRVTT